jgi:hypothetical protein
MAEQPTRSPTPRPSGRPPQAPTVQHLSNNRVRVEFDIDQVLDRLLLGSQRGGIVIASCGGCNGCSATA